MNNELNRILTFYAAFIRGNKLGNGLSLDEAEQAIEAYISKRELELLKDMQQEHETGAFYSKIIEERIEKLNIGENNG